VSVSGSGMASLSCAVGAGQRLVDDPPVDAVEIVVGEVDGFRTGPTGPRATSRRDDRACTDVMGFASSPVG
jgi:hypothetical protein